MSISPLRAPKGATKKKNIVGRGRSSGSGKTSGKGHKGQKARSGGGVRLGFEGGQMPLYRRVAARGFARDHFFADSCLRSPGIFFTAAHCRNIR